VREQRPLGRWGAPQPFGSSLAGVDRGAKLAPGAKVPDGVRIAGRSALAQRVLDRSTRRSNLVLSPTAVPTGGAV